MLLFILGICTLYSTVCSAQQEDVIFYEDFTDNRNEWHIGDYERNAFDVRNGYYYYTHKKEKDGWYTYNSKISAIIDNKKDFVIETAFLQVAGKEDWGTGLILFFDETTTITYGLYITSDGKWGIVNDKKMIVEWTTDEIINKNNNVKNILKFLKKGNTIYCIINGKEVHREIYKDLPILHVGFEIGSIKTVAIDYLKISYLSNDITPPTIAVYNPSVSRGLKIVEKNKTISVTGKVTDESGIYEVIINGTEVQVDADGNFNSNVPLAIGDNKLQISATDVKMNKSNYQFTVNRPAAAKVEQNEPIIAVNVEEGKYYALIIGIEEYQDPTISDLEQPVTDATTLNNILLSKYTFEKEDIKLLKNPTRYQIFQALEAFSKKVKQSDNLLIFYAGHGLWDEQRRQGYWFPADGKRADRSSWVTNADLKEYISSIQSKHTLLITDACFAGSIFKSRSIMAGASRAIKELYEMPSRKAMTSGSLKEVPDKSVFIEYLVKRLTQNSEKYLSAEQLFSSFRTAVINNSANGQVPQFGEIKEAGDEGGDFIFITR